MGAFPAGFDARIYRYFLHGVRQWRQPSRGTVGDVFSLAVLFGVLFSLVFVGALLGGVGLSEKELTLCAADMGAEAG